MPNLLDLCGWHFKPREIERIQGLQRHPTLVMAAIYSGLKAKRETTLLFDCLTKLLGEFPVLCQEDSDCTAQGAATAIDVLKSVQISLNKTHAQFKGITATEPIYALGRNEISKGIFKGGGGCSGAAVAEACKVYGTLVRDIYGSYDLRKYNVNTVRKWQDSGLPDELEPIAKEHTVKSISRVSSVEEMIAAIVNGYPVTIACMQGFANKRDINGFSYPEGVWPHQQCIVGYRTDVEGVCIQNSWGSRWISGPKNYNQPDGSYWVKIEVMDDLFRKDNDCWAYSNFEEFPPQELNWRIV